MPWGAGLGEVPAANVAAGRTPMISFGRAGSPRAVAAGRHDRYLAALARSVAALGRPVLLRYAWGMDGASLRTPGPGRRLRGRLAARPRPVRRPGRARLLGVVAERRRLRRARGAASTGTGRATTTSTGSAADGFNWGGCNGRSAWRDFGAIFKAFYSWGSARAKPLMISGTGTVEDPIDPGRKRGWYLDAAGALARSMPRIRAVVLLDQGGRCDWRPDTSAPSMQGFVDFARDPFFGGAAQARRRRLRPRQAADDHRPGHDHHA